jgi:hypothetical protein
VYFNTIFRVCQGKNVNYIRRKARRISRVRGFLTFRVSLEFFSIFRDNNLMKYDIILAEVGEGGKHGTGRVFFLLPSNKTARPRQIRW